uniref:Uncharacterized protein n=1 Tax=Elaeophora elaphi TaxID=1147741 RepID=A0A0R3RW13_9BILA
MNQGGDSNLPYKHYHTIAQNQPNPFMNRNLSSGDNNLFPSLPSNLRERNLLNPLNGSILELTRPSGCHEPDPESNAKLHFLNDPLVIIKPLMSSSTSHLLTPQVIEKPESTTNTRMGKEVIFTGTGLNFTSGTNQIERPVPKKPRSFSAGSDQFTIGCSALSPPAAQTSRIISNGKINRSTSTSTVIDKIETDNEISALKARIDSLYTKLNEIQRIRDAAIQTLQSDKERRLSESSALVNIDEDSCSARLKTANNTVKAISSTANENSQVCQFITNSNQNDERTLNETTNEMTCPANSAEKTSSRKLNDTWENTDQLSNTELTVSDICQEKTSSEIGANEDIILVDCPQEVTEEKVKNNDQNLINDNLDTSNSTTVTNRNPESNGTCGAQSFDDQTVQQKSDKLKDQYNNTNSASYKLETKDAIIAVKRIQKFWDATYLSPHIKMTKECVNTNIQHDKITQSSPPCFLPPNHLTQSSTPIGFQQPRTAAAFQPPAQFGPMLCFSNISASAENYPYFANSHNPYSQSEPLQFLTSNQLPKQFIPTMNATPIQAFQHPNPLLNVQFPAVGNAICANANHPITNSLSHNSYIANRKLLFKNRMMSSSVRKKIMNSKSRNASAQTVSPINNIISVPNAVSYDRVAKEKSITRVCGIQILLHLNGVCCNFDVMK